MAFTQFTLDRSFNQARGIFDKYVYRTADLMVDVTSDGYFSKSRYIDDPDWFGSIIDCACGDGYFVGIIGQTAVTNILLPDREVILRASSTQNQNPVGTDNPLIVEFGPAVGTIDDLVMLSASGDVTINVAGNYHFTVNTQYGRVGNNGVATLWQGIRVNGVAIGGSIPANLINSNSDFPFSTSFTLNLPAGAVFNSVIWRDGDGADDGGYIYKAPTLSGVGEAFSADLVISKYIMVPG